MPIVPHPYQANILRLSHESVEKGNRDAVRMLRHRAEQKEQNLKQTIHDMDSKHSKTLGPCDTQIDIFLFNLIKDVFLNF